MDLNKNKLKAGGAVLIALALVFGGATAASAAKAGGSCSKVNSTSVSGSKLLKCTKKGSKKVWVSAGIAYGTSAAPAPVGTAVKVGTASFALTSVEEGIDAWICEENSFNDGCTWGDGFDVIVDPTSSKKWLRFNIDVTNNGSDIFEPYFGDVGVIVGGKIIWQGWLQPTVSGGVDDLTVLPGTTDSGALYVQIPKGSSATQLVLRPNLFEKKFYFFKTN